MSNNDSSTPELGPNEPTEPSDVAETGEPNRAGMHRWWVVHAAWALVAAVLFFVGLGTGPSEEEIDTRVAELVSDRETELDQMQERLESESRDLDARETRAEDREADTAQQEADLEQAAAEQEKQFKERAAEQEKRFKERAAELDAREAEIAQAEDAVAARTVTDGVWTVGVDIEPGTYRAQDVGSSCYWAITRSGTNGNDIIENDLPPGGNPQVTLSQEQDFTSRECGEWIRQ